MSLFIAEDGSALLMVWKLVLGLVVVWEEV